ncbi:hypothetical protein EJ03DRAFT_361549 [Teratosphaeria nubilosa]|uniref:Protein kinase domain-containing protein n=1 Tax=Teratosphaeria nubilosa TaxID=161662 RepID=A0A6G1LBF7_9PEZI|nr:hypothetical protein EJ03DRAFT_361549 [Teratosphaeria nubilosa]
MPEDICTYSLKQLDTAKLFIKRPKIASYLGSTVLADRFLIEVETHNLTKRNPHPNLVQFQGCIARNGRATGLILRRYAGTLMDVVGDSEGSIRSNVTQ